MLANRISITPDIDSVSLEISVIPANVNIYYQKKKHDQPISRVSSIILELDLFT